MDNKSFQALGTYLRQKRIKKKLTQVSVAKKLDYTSQFIANWERGVSSPPLEALKKIIDIYEITPNEFLAKMASIQKDYIKRNIFNSESKVSK